MQKFRNILVGIDIGSDGDIAAGSQGAFTEACWLAKCNDAALTLVHVVDIPEEVQQVLDLQPQSAPAKWVQRVRATLARLALETGRPDTHTHILYGKHWRALMREVADEKHDLVVVGTRGRGMAGRALLGSTGNRLLRYCPCPVWAVKSQHKPARGPVLVAHDLTPVGEKALQLGLGLAALRGAPLQVLHVLEHPEEQRFLGTIPGDEVLRREDIARREIERQCREYGPEVAAEVVMGHGCAYAAILRQVSEQGSDLLCMGTVARSGLAGLVTGNTAEQILPWVPCSLLAVKHEDFVSPPGMP